MNPDLYIFVTYNIDSPDDFRIKTNCQRKKLHSLIADCIQDRPPGPEDPVINRDEYEIKLFYSFENDQWHADSNTGNVNLTMGILMEVLKLLGKNKPESPNWQKLLFEDRE